MKERSMGKPLVAVAVSGALLAGGCATVFCDGRRAGSELVGRSARLDPARGQPSTLFFERDGIVRSVFGQRQAAGRWSVRNRQLCFTWAGNFRECWPYAAPLQPGRTRTIMSDRGNVVRVTLR
jgi:hypothetical protein